MDKKQVPFPGSSRQLRSLQRGQGHRDHEAKPSWRHTQSTSTWSVQAWVREEKHQELEAVSCKPYFRKMVQMLICKEACWERRVACEWGCVQKANALPSQLGRTAVSHPEGSENHRSFVICSTSWCQLVSDLETLNVLYMRGRWGETDRQILPLHQHPQPHVIWIFKFNQPSNTDWVPKTPPLFNEGTFSFTLNYVEEPKLPRVLSKQLKSLLSEVEGNRTGISPPVVPGRKRKQC